MPEELPPASLPSSERASPASLPPLEHEFRELRHSVNNSLAVMMALSEMMQRRPEMGEKLSKIILEKGPDIVARLKHFGEMLEASRKSAPTGEP